MRQCNGGLAALGLSLMLSLPAANAQLQRGVQSTLDGLVDEVGGTLGEVLDAGAPGAIAGQYIVVPEDDSGPVSPVVQQLLSSVGGQFLAGLPIINAAVVRVDALSARILAASPLVGYGSTVCSAASRTRKTSRTATATARMSLAPRLERPTVLPSRPRSTACARWIARVVARIRP